jgi:hypothetical protein
MKLILARGVGGGEHDGIDLMATGVEEHEVASLVAQLHPGPIERDELGRAKGALSDTSLLPPTAGVQRVSQSTTPYNLSPASPSPGTM